MGKRYNVELRKLLWAVKSMYKIEDTVELWFDDEALDDAGNVELVLSGENTATVIHATPVPAKEDDKEGEKKDE